jgi:hypothetical protein
MLHDSASRCGKGDTCTCSRACCGAWRCWERGWLGRTCSGVGWQHGGRSVLRQGALNHLLYSRRLTTLASTLPLQCRCAPSHFHWHRAHHTSTAVSSCATRRFHCCAVVRHTTLPMLCHRAPPRFHHCIVTILHPKRDAIRSSPATALAC